MKIHLVAVWVLGLGSTIALAEKLPVPPSSLPKEIQTQGAPLRPALWPIVPGTLTRIEGSTCERKEISRFRNNENNAAVVSYDLNCSGKANANYIVPDRQTDAVMLTLDRNGDGKPDVIFFDFKRWGRWDLSFCDAKFEGQWTLVGYHDDGTLKPTRFERYEDFQKRLAAQ